MGKREAWTEEFTIDGASLDMTLRDLIREGNARRVIVKNAQGKTLLKLPLTLAALAAMKEGGLGALAALGVMTGHLTIIVEKVGENPDPEPGQGG